MKSIESQLYEVGQENKRLHERWAYMESNMANNVARVVINEIANCFIAGERIDLR